MDTHYREVSSISILSPKHVIRWYREIITDVTVLITGFKGGNKEKGRKLSWVIGSKGSERNNAFDIFKSDIILGITKCFYYYSSRKT